MTATQYVYLLRYRSGKFESLIIRPHADAGRAAAERDMTSFALSGQPDPALMIWRVEGAGRETTFTPIFEATLP